jgi:hypothetical protein
VGARSLPSRDDARARLVFLPAVNCLANAAALLHGHALVIDAVMHHAGFGWAALQSDLAVAHTSSATGPVLGQRSSLVAKRVRKFVCAGPNVLAPTFAAYGHLGRAPTADDLERERPGLRPAPQR